MVLTVIILLVPRAVAGEAVLVRALPVVLALTQVVPQLILILAGEVLGQTIPAGAARQEQLIITVRVQMPNGVVAVAVGQIKMAALVELGAVQYLAALPVARVAV